MVTVPPHDGGRRPCCRGGVRAAGCWPCARRHGLPVTGNSIQDERRRQDRTRHFLGYRPRRARGWPRTAARSSGCRSPSSGRATGCSPSWVRCRAARAGVSASELLRLALAHGEPDEPRDDPVLAGSKGDGALHGLRLRAAPGRRRPGAPCARTQWTRPSEVERYEPDQVGERRADGGRRHRPHRARLGPRRRHRRHVGAAGEPALAARRTRATRSPRTSAS